MKSLKIIWPNETWKIHTELQPASHCQSQENGDKHEGLFPATCTAVLQTSMFFWSLSRSNIRNKTFLRSQKTVEDQNICVDRISEQTVLKVKGAVQKGTIDAWRGKAMPNYLALLQAQGLLSLQGAAYTVPKHKLKVQRKFRNSSQVYLFI